MNYTSRHWKWFPWQGEGRMETICERMQQLLSGNWKSIQTRERTRELGRAQQHHHHCHLPVDRRANWREACRNHGKRTKTGALFFNRSKTKHFLTLFFAAILPSAAALPWFWPSKAAIPRGVLGRPCVEVSGKDEVTGADCSLLSGKMDYFHGYFEMLGGCLLLAVINAWCDRAQAKVVRSSTSLPLEGWTFHTSFSLAGSHYELQQSLPKVVEMSAISTLMNHNTIYFYWASLTNVNYYVQ